jgi:hypothetical protein
MRPEDLLSNERLLLLAVEAVYEIVEWCAELTGNQYFGIEAGLAMDVMA